MDECSKPAINARATVIGTSLEALSKNPAVGQATTNVLKSVSGGQVLSLSDMHGNKLRLQVIKIISYKLSETKRSTFLRELFEYDFIKRCTKCIVIRLKIISKNKQKIE